MNFVSLERHKRALVSLLVSPFVPKKWCLLTSPHHIRFIAILQRGLYNLSRRFGLRCRIADNEVASHQLHVPREGKGLRIGRLFGYGSSEVALVLDEYCR